MAIAYQSSNTGSGSTAGSTNVSLNVGTGSDRFLVVSVQYNHPPYSSFVDGDVTSVTYNGTNATKLDAISALYQGQGLNLWVLQNPSSGTNNVTVTYNTDCYPYIAVAAYTGVAQSVTNNSPTGHLLENESNSASSSSFDISVTTTADNSWIVGCFRTINTPTAETGSYIRVGTNSGFILDTDGAKTPTGSYSIGINQTASAAAGIIATLAPAASASGPANVKTWNGITTANTKTVNGIAIANVKTGNGIA